MSTSTILCILQCILLYYSSHLLSLKADECKWPQTCGNLPFPYPFQVDQNTCGLPGFSITCKGKTKYNPGTPFLQTRLKEVQVLNISDDHILVDYSVLHASPCNRSGNGTNVIKKFSLSEQGPFRISEFNRFLVVGCDTNGQYKMFLNSSFEYPPFSGSCIPSCIYTDKQQSCDMPVPGGYSSIKLTTQFLSLYGKGNCSNSTSALVDIDTLERISSSKTFKDSQNYSLRLDWAIPNETCSSVRNKSSYQCSPSAECTHKEWGYVCNCKPGYNGDGYKKGTGCREIKKCSRVGCFQALPMITGICGTIAVLLGCGGLFWIMKLRKSKRDKEKNFRRNGEDHSGELKGVQLFSLNEIEKATKKFAQKLILGTGGYGTVYKGILTNGKVVAVKKPKEVNPEVDSKQVKEFINEVNILKQINHPNVVKLLGCCLESPVPLLVYEYISNGTLFNHLHGDNEKQQPLSWEQRLCIATGTAEALSHLHSAPSTPIIHGDVKSANILLDNDYNPKVTDFGASRPVMPMGQRDSTNVVQGTQGYLDPEYLQTIYLTEKSDVYSFGVVLLELLTGLKPVSCERKEQTNLVRFFLATAKTKDLTEIIDPRLDVGEGQNLESMRRLVRLAEYCLSAEGANRPSMKEVVEELHGLKPANDCTPG